MASLAPSCCWWYHHPTQSCQSPPLLSHASPVFPGTNGIGTSACPGLSALHAAHVVETSPRQAHVSLSANRAELGLKCSLHHRAWQPQPACKRTTADCHASRAVIRRLAATPSLQAPEPTCHPSTQPQQPSTPQLPLLTWLAASQVTSLLPCRRLPPSWQVPACWQAHLLRGPLPQPGRQLRVMCQGVRLHRLGIAVQVAAGAGSCRVCTRV
jgi:hypothetical protein